MRTGVQSCVTTFACILALSVAVNANYNQLVKANCKFAVSLYSRVSDDDNVVLSPYSISGVMAMAYAGSAGVTKTELEKVLGFKRMNSLSVHKSFRSLLGDQSKTSKGSTFYIANRVFASRKIKIKTSYQKLMRMYYGSSVKVLRFDTKPLACMNFINEWVSKNTGDMIQNMLEKNDIRSNTDLVLASAIYFKSDWQVPFDKSDTAPDTFHLSGGGSMQVDMMVKKSMFNYGVSKQLGCHVVELPYKGDASMYIFLPWAVDGLGDMQKEMSVDNINAAIAGLTKRLTYVYLPKFTVSSDINLHEALRKMGLKHFFNDANLSGITSCPIMSITKAKHSATIEVNEQGTEASAATVFISTRSFGVPLVVDRPFGFIIRERSSGTFLFMGHVNKPPKAQTKTSTISYSDKRMDIMMKKMMNYQRKKYLSYTI